MQIIIVDHRRGRTRRFDTQAPLFRVAAGVCGIVVAVLCVAMLWSGWSLGVGTAPQQLRIVDVGGHDAAEQQEEISRLRQQLRDESAAFARRLAALQAHVVRIDAAGERMARLAALDDGEFNFAEPPALGGPATEGGTMEVAPLAALAEELDALELRIASRQRQLRVLEDFLVNTRVSEQSKPEGLPVTAGFISSGYGQRRDPFTGRRSFHHGLDFAAPTGETIAAVGSGIVEFSGYRDFYGNTIDVNHGNGYVTRYAHNSELLVEVGERVTRGQIIARVGATGRATGPHLHFEVWRDGRTVNPSQYIRAAR